MKLTATLRALLLSLLAVAAGTVQPKQLTLEFINKSTSMLGRIPGIQLGWLISNAENDSQLPEVQDAVAQVVQDAFNNFSNLDNRARFKLLKSYTRLLTSPLLSDEQKNFLRDSIIPAVSPQVRPLSQQEAEGESTRDAASLQATLVQNGIIPASQTLAPAVQQTVATVSVAPATAVAPAPAPLVVQQATAVPVSNTTPLTVTPAANVTTLMQTVPAPNTTPVVQQAVTNGQTLTPVPTATQTIVSGAATAAIVNTLAPIAQPVINAIAPVAQVVNPAPAPIALSPVATPAAAAQPVVVNEATINAIVQDSQKNTATKAATLSALINNLPPQTAVDSKTSGAIAQAIQDLYNAQENTDTRSIAQLLTSATQKPVLTAEQRDYVQTTLVPAINQQLTTTTALTAPVATVAAPTQINHVAPQVAAPAIVAAAPTQPAVVVAAPATLQIPATAAVVAPTSTVQPTIAPAAAITNQTINNIQNSLEDSIKGLYLQMQQANGKTFDAATQGSFGASLVEAFNNVVEIQSYMSQLLKAAEETPLLNEAQQRYVRDVMIPNLDQVSEATPTKTLDQAVAPKGATPDAIKAKNDTMDTKKGKGEKSKSKKPKKGKKAAKADGKGTPDATVTTEAAATDTAATTDNAPATTAKPKKKSGKKKLKKAAKAIPAAEKEGGTPTETPAAEAKPTEEVTPTATTKPEKPDTPQRAKKKVKKLKKAKKLQPKDVTADAGTAQAA